jgi:hypothetical protein
MSWDGRKDFFNVIFIEKKLTNLIVSKFKVSDKLKYSISRLRINQ